MFLFLQYTNILVLGIKDAIYMHTYIMYVCIIGMFVCMIMSVFINILAASVCLECSTVNSVGSEV